MDRHFRGIVALMLAMVVMVMAFTGCIGINESSSGSSVSQVKVVVDYNGSWSGEVGALGSLKSFNGTGPQEYTVNRGNDSIFVVTALAHKGDASNATLTVSIKNMNGTVIKSESTSTAYGVATVAATIS